MAHSQLVQLASLARAATLPHVSYTLEIYPGACGVIAAALHSTSAAMCFVHTRQVAGVEVCMATMAQAPGTRSLPAGRFDCNEHEYERNKTHTLKRLCCKKQHTELGDIHTTHLRHKQWRKPTHKTPHSASKYSYLNHKEDST